MATWRPQKWRQHTANMAQARLQTHLARHSRFGRCALCWGGASQPICPDSLEAPANDPEDGPIDPKILYSLHGHQNDSKPTSKCNLQNTVVGRWPKLDFTTHLAKHFVFGRCALCWGGAAPPDPPSGGGPTSQPICPDSLEDPANDPEDGPIDPKILVSLHGHQNDSNLISKRNLQNVSLVKID